MPSQWDTNDTDEPKDRAKKGDAVRLELSRLSEIVLHGGIWKGIQFAPPKNPGPVHVVIISHNQFLKVLTHRSDLPGKLYSHTCLPRSI